MWVPVGVLFGLFGAAAMAVALPADAEVTQPVSTSCVGQTVTPATNISTTVNTAPAGTTFCFAPGTYNVAIKPKSGQTFDGGNRGAILDGGNSRRYAIRADHTSEVTIKGFVIQHYNTPLQEGAIQAFDTTDWTIADNHITRNGASGVATDSGARVLHNLIDHNAQQGYAAHGDNILYDGNEIAYNNESLGVDATWEAGGGKSWATRNASFRNNRVHHNGGNGMWDDTNNIYISYDHNLVFDNWGAGIYHEIGYDATITNNIVENNGTSTSQGGGQDQGWLWDAGIQLRSSGGLTPDSPILISGNTVTNNYNGIALLDSPASGCSNSDLEEGAYGPCRIQNVLVRNNNVRMNQGATGFVIDDGPDESVFASRNVEFRDNKYLVNTTDHVEDGHSFDWFAWANDWHAWGAWKRFGNDAAGAFGR